MRKRAGILMLLTVGQACAAGGIVPTPDPGSDCVAAKILAERTAHNRPYEERSCAVNKDRAAFERCLRYVSAQPTIAFFTDRCNAPADGAYVSFNGATRTVHRQPGSRHPDVDYAGTWSGAGVTVRIMPVQLIERFPEGRVTYRVDVRITAGEASVRIPAVYDDRL